MFIFKDISKSNITDGCVICLGNFDGVHLGHAKLISKTKELAESMGLKAGVYTFEVNSKIILGNSTISLLTTEEEKNSILSDYGMDFVVCDDFSTVKGLTPEEFCNYLTENINIKAVVCGENYRFGKKACAGPAELTEIMSQKNIICCTVDEHCIDGKTVSSTAIRNMITSGDTEGASKMLGYRYFICAEVVHGAALGRTLGFPTINQYFYGNKTVPAHGVYCTACYFEGKKFYGVTNIGIKPTVTTSQNSVNAETYIIDFDGDLYGKEIRVEFFKMLRPEIKFNSLDELKKNVLSNIEETKKYFGKEFSK